MSTNLPVLGAFGDNQCGSCAFLGVMPVPHQLDSTIRAFEVSTTARRTGNVFNVSAMADKILLTSPAHAVCLKGVDLRTEWKSHLRMWDESSGHAHRDHETECALMHEMFSKPRTCGMRKSHTPGIDPIKSVELEAMDNMHKSIDDRRTKWEEETEKSRRRFEALIAIGTIILPSLFAVILAKCGGPQDVKITNPLVNVVQSAVPISPTVRPPTLEEPYAEIMRIFTEMP